MAETECPDGKAVLAIPGVHLWNGRRIPISMRPERSFWWMAKRWTRSPAVLGCGLFGGPERGIFLNGTSYPLTACPGIRTSRHRQRHHEGVSRPGYGDDQGDRSQHYPSRPLSARSVFLRSVRRGRMIVWAEIPYISEHMPNGRENTISQMKELIIQNYNHPAL